MKKNRYNPGTRKKVTPEMIFRRLSERSAAATLEQQARFKGLVRDCDPARVPMSRMLSAMIQTQILTNDEAIEITKDLVACGLAVT